MNQINTRKVHFRNHVICYHLARKDVNNINLRVRPDGSIQVSANWQYEDAYIDDFVFSKGNYIVKALQRYQSMQEGAMAEKEYVSGEGFAVLGKELRLKVIEGACEYVKADGGYLVLSLESKKNYDRKHSLVESYFNEVREKIFTSILENLYPPFAKYGVQKPIIQIREMQSRWGSCSQKKRHITLNKSLLVAPKTCVAYVVLHELCHFVHPNHSRDFYSLLTAFMPDWQERKALLEKYGRRDC